MRDIFFYDFDFNLLADYPRFISFNIEPQYCGYGSAEVHFSLNNAEILTLLENNEYLFFVCEGYSAIVTGWKVTDDIAIFGRTCEWLLTRRGINAFSRSQETPTAIVWSIVNAAAGDFITLGSGAWPGTAQDYTTDKVRVLYDVVCEVLKAQKLGFRLVPDIKTKQFIFTVYSGSESLVLLSQSNRTAYDMTYTVEKQDMATKSGWYERKIEDMGEWDAYNNSPRLTNNVSANAYKYYKVSSVTGTQFGITFEKGDYVYSDTADGSLKKGNEKPDNVWVYINNTNVSGACKWDTVLSGTKTESEAFAELEGLGKKETATAETRNVEYGTDYKLGDIVRVQFEVGKFKKIEKKRVTSIRVYFDVDKSGIVPVLSSLEE